jgi:hypothetical protein
MELVSMQTMQYCRVLCLGIGIFTPFLSNHVCAILLTCITTSFFMTPLFLRTPQGCRTEQPRELTTLNGVVAALNRSNGPGTRTVSRRARRF